MGIFVFIVLVGFVGIVINVFLASIIAVLRKNIGNSSTLVLKRPIKTASVLIPAYNEEENIIKKLDNLKTALDMVEGVSLEVILGSDGSTDMTVSLAEQWIQNNSVKDWSIQQYDNEGKCHTINKMVRSSNGEVIISTDADVIIPESAVNAILDAFRSDAGVGCVSCVPVFTGQEIGNQGRYWDIEGRIRKAESKVGLLIVTTGGLYAYRREAFQDIPRGVMADDLWVPLMALLKGYRSIQLDDLAVLFENTNEETEVRRRRRVIAGGIDVVRRLWGRLTKKPAVLALVLAHKVNRWALPVWIAFILIGLISLEPLLIAVFTIAALLSWIVFGTRRLRIILNAVTAPLSALIEVARTKDLAKWQHTRVK